MIKYNHYSRVKSLYPPVTAFGVSCSGGFLTFGTTAPHGLSIGDKVKLTGYVPLNVNGIYTVTAVPSSTGFTTDVACSGVPSQNGTFQNYNLGTFERLYPLGFKSIVWEHQDGEIFSRRKMPDELTFTNEPNNSNFNFTYFYDIDQASSIYSFRCNEIQYYIERSCDLGETYEPFWFGYFAVNDGKFDIDRCIYKVKIKVDDEYRCLIENGDKDINILQTTPSESVNIDYALTFEFIDCGCTNVGPTAQATFNGCIYPDLQDDGCSPAGFPCGAPLFTNPSCITGGVGWQLYTNTYHHSGGGVFSVCSIYVRQTATTLDVGGNPNPPNGSGWINLGSTTIGGQDATNWARIPYNGIYNTYVWTTSGSPSCVFTAQLTLPLNSITTYTTARKMEDVVNFASSQNCTDFSAMASDFFEINPPGDTPGYVPGDNYVTGDTNKINLLMFIQKSDFLLPAATTKAVKGILTFNQLMNIFKQVFQTYWFIENNQIRIEHISWFTQTQAFNLTALPYLKFVNGKNKYEYIKEKMPREENWKWIESGNADFLGLPVIYDSACVDQDKINNTTIESVVTDVEFIFNNTSNSSKEGFVLVATEANGGDYDILSEVGLISGTILPNNHLSLANLLYNYFRHNRVLLEGIMNDNQETFFSAIKTKKQVPISFPFCCEDELIPEQSTIETELGTGYIQSDVTLDIKTNMITMELVYD